jgi:hypothetical protein
MKRGPKKILSTTEKKKKDENRNNINNSKDDSTRRSNKLHKHDLDARTWRPSFGSAKKNSQQASKRALPKP